VIPVQLADAIILQSNVIEVAQYRAQLGYISLGVTLPTARKVSPPSSWSLRRLELAKPAAILTRVPQATQSNQ
jgi:hypothetical protein